jgi:hypothetical protein
MDLRQKDGGNRKYYLVRARRHVAEEVARNDVYLSMMVVVKPS